MINRIMATADEAVAGIKDGDTVLVGGFGEAGMPHELIAALIRQGARDLTVVSNNAGTGHTGLGGLLEAKRVRKIICSYPRSTGSIFFEEQWGSGELELELVPQGTLSERIRAAAAGIGAFYVRTGVGTRLADGKEVRDIDGETWVMEKPIRADAALIKADRGDRWGNLTYRLSARNFGPVMAAASKLTIAQVREVVPLGALDAENIVTPGIFVDRIWQVA
jgi:3-oxoadipate CoA-transferase alpha subunit